MSTWQSMMRISDAQIKEIEANPDLLDVFLYTTGKRSMMEQLAEMQGYGTHNVFSTGHGYIITQKNSDVRVILPWYTRLWNFFSRQPSEIKIERPAPPTVPEHWQPFSKSEDQCNLEQNFDLIFYLFTDCKMPGTPPLNFMLGTWGRAVNSDSGCMYITADKMDEIIAAVEAVPEETLRKRYRNIERLEALGCGYASDFEGDEYDQYIGVVIADMRRFLHHVREKGDGMLIQLG
ncbi:MAG: YfbM family protein [Planctomycetaceae bacterium]|nr:YfbM family protein [Planctomycetaceae bacterium]